MIILSCLIWGILSAFVMVGAIKWYLPKLRKQDIQKNSVNENLGKNRKKYLLILCLMVILAMICGGISYNRQDEIINMIKMLITLCILGVISLTDIELYKIPNLCCVILLVGRTICFIPEFIINIEKFKMSLFNSVLTGILCLVLLVVISKVTRSGLGYGDIKLFAALGFMCGMRAILYTLVICFFICAIASLVLLILKIKSVKDELPLGPFIYLGFVTTIILGLC